MSKLGEAMVMKRDFPKSLRGLGTILAIVVIVAGVLEPAHGQTEGVTLILQQTPSDGGTVTPVPGVHRFELNAEVTLTAIPKPGYQFICWLGDVSDRTAERTVAYLDRPKIVVALFERAEYDTLTKGRTSGGGRAGSSSGSGGFVSSAGDFGWRGPGGAAGPAPGPRITKQAKAEAFVPEPEPPGPPAPVPEPATGILLTLGGLFAFARRGAKGHA